jgi:hypothetical protein
MNELLSNTEQDFSQDKGQNFLRKLGSVKNITTR